MYTSHISIQREQHNPGPVSLTFLTHRILLKCRWERNGFLCHESEMPPRSSRRTRMINRIMRRRRIGKRKNSERGNANATRANDDERGPLHCTIITPFAPSYPRNRSLSVEAEQSGGERKLLRTVEQSHVGVGNSISSLAILPSSPCSRGIVAALILPSAKLDRKYGASLMGVIIYPIPYFVCASSLPHARAQHSWSQEA